MFPIDEETLAYLRLTGRPVEQVALVEAYAHEQGLWREPGAGPDFDESSSSTWHPWIPAWRVPDGRRTGCPCRTSATASRPPSRVCSGDLAREVPRTMPRASRVRVARPTARTVPSPSRSTGRRPPSAAARWPSPPSPRAPTRATRRSWSVRACWRGMPSPVAWRSGRRSRPASPPAHASSLGTSRRPA